MFKAKLNLSSLFIVVFILQQSYVHWHLNNFPYILGD